MSGGLQISPDLELPLEAVTETIAILAKRGKGKTNTAVVMVEEMVAAGMPAVVIDPVGVWWGLRSSGDGQSEGLPVVIFGGDHGDLPLDPNAGELIADVLVDQRFTAVLDLSHLSKGGSRRFMTGFIERLYHRNRQALHVVVDEADAFAPQRAQADGARLLGAMEDLVRRGRARGIGVTLITQRPAVLHKDVLTQAEVLIALGMTGPRDVAAIDEWVRLHADEDQAKEVKASLPSLPVGTAWVWSPGWLDILKKVRIRARHTFDSSATPKPGQQRRTPATRAQVDLAALGAQIAATAERAKADDPKTLRADIARLTKELAAAQGRAPAVEYVEVPVLDPAHLDAFSEAVAGLMDRLQEIEGKLLSFPNELPTEGKQGQPTTRNSAPRANQASSTTGRAPVARPSTHRMQNPSPAQETRPVAGDGLPELRAGARRMVEALGRMAPLRLTKSQWGTVAKLKTSGGTWSTYLSDIRRAGLVDEDPAGFTLTAAGFDYLGGRPAPMTADELQQHYRSILRSGAVKMLDALIDAYPNGLTRDELGEGAGIATSGGTFSTYLSDLVRNGLAERVDGQLVATSVLMLGADQ